MKYPSYDQCTQQKETKPRSLSKFQPWPQEHKHGNMILPSEKRQHAPYEHTTTC